MKNKNKEKGTILIISPDVSWVVVEMLFETDKPQLSLPDAVILSIKLIFNRQEVKYNSEQ